MTSTVTKATLTIFADGSYRMLATTLSIVVILLLLVLLVVKELMRSTGGPQAKSWGQALNVAIVPLLLAFGLSIGLRINTVSDDNLAVDAAAQLVATATMAATPVPASATLVPASATPVPASATAPAQAAAPSPSPTAEPPTSAPTHTPQPAPTAQNTATPETTATVPAEFITYSVRKGDILYTLAISFNTTVEAIVALNPNIDPASLAVGETIRIPTTATGEAPAPAEFITYSVRKGDILYTLAISFNTTAEAIVALNPNIDPASLVVGETIRIPTRR